MSQQQSNAETVHDPLQWRDRVLTTLLNAAMLVAGTTLIALALFVPNHALAVLVNPRIGLAALFCVAIVLVRFLPRAGYSVRLWTYQISTFGLGTIASVSLGPLSGSTAILCSTVITAGLLGGVRWLVTTLVGSTAVVAAAFVLQPPLTPELIGIQPVRGAAMYFVACGVLAIVVHRVVAEIERGLQTTRETLQQLEDETTRHLAAKHQLNAAQSAMEEAQQLEAVGRLAGGVAHDFNNILQIIMLWADQLSYTATDEQKQGIEAIKNSSRDASVLTRQLLAVARQQVGEPIVVDVRDLVEALAPSIQRVLPDDVVLALETHQVAPVFIDPSLLTHVVLNLVINARDAMPLGGTCTVGVHGLRPGELPFDVESSANRWMCLSVADTGTGIDEDTRQHIFEPFYTTKSTGGTGLGLASAQGIVERAEGRITVDTEVDVGSVFQVFLPCSTEKRARKLRGSKTLLLDGRPRGRLLLVEDESAVREVMRMALESEGWTVHEAENGDRAVEVASELDALELLCTDAVMPGKPTHEAIAEILKVHPKAMVLLCSGYLKAELVQRNIESGEFAHLAKPFTSRQLIKQIRSMFDPAVGSSN